MIQLINRGFKKEFKFKASKSGGKGGQHVNKVMTKAELIFNVPASKILTEEEKALLQEKIAHKLSAEGNLRIAVEETRSQLENKYIAIERFYKLMENALKKPKVRKETKPSKNSIEKRHKAKRVASERKESRKKIKHSARGDE